MTRINMPISKVKLPFTIYVRLNADCKIGCQQKVLQLYSWIQSLVLIKKNHGGEEFNTKGLKYFVGERERERENLIAQPVPQLA